MDKNRERAERLVDALRPKLIDLVAELLDNERGADAPPDEPARIDGISQEGYVRAQRTVARWQMAGKTKKVRKAG